MDDNQERMEEIKNPDAEQTEAETKPPEPSKADETAQRLAEAEKQVEYYKDLLLRKVADFDNFKKRMENDSAATLKYAKVDIIQSLLPVIDDFERSLKLSKDRRESEAFAKGVDLIYQKLVRFLDTQGVKEIDSLGKEFDVHYHDALLQVPRIDVPPHVVIEVVEKGYSLDDRVLRHAKVVVSTTPDDHGAHDVKGSPNASNPGTGTTTKREN
ncbi:MAG: nucleotide exchange factor GrpE [Ignavibacteriales bacterium]|nr:nucleotide exchange factor GrpE [Ignavibacteriales bacterium]